MRSMEDPLLAEVRAMCTDAHWRRAILRHCADLDPGAALPRLRTDIHANDQMLVHSLRHHRDAGAAFSQYFAIALQQYAVARRIQRLVFGGRADAIDVLDFACGYGRLLRFLVLALPPGRIVASELQPDALDFVAATFGVQALPSCADPDRFRAGRRFDFIWVASLFSHLPEALFHGWLRTLLALLAPHGVLCFSVRDADLLPAGEELPPSGIRYDRRSENAGLGADIYGTTWAGEAFVRRALREAGGRDPAVQRLPRALANEQDLYVVAADAGADLSALRAFRRGPWGWVDRRELSPSGELCLQGWAASLDDGAVEQVEIEVDGARYRCATGLARADVGAAFADARLAHSGWTFRCQVDPATPAPRVEVGARSARGETALLYAGRVRTPPAAAARGDGPSGT